MRFIITLEKQQNQTDVLPINYQYELSSWIYNTIAGGDAVYSEWLHSNGFNDGHKRFKLFTFSHLNIPEKRIFDDRLQVLSDRIDFRISFLPRKSTEEFIKGVFSKQEFSLGDYKSNVMFRVGRIEKIPDIVFSDEMEFETLSPVVVSVKRENGSAHFTEPEDENMALYLGNNLLQKYKAFRGSDFKGLSDIRFELIGKARKKGITIKTGTRAQTRVIGYLYRFRFRCPVELMDIGYHAGFGEKNSMGFGCVEVRGK